MRLLAMAAALLTCACAQTAPGSPAVVAAPSPTVPPAPTARDASAAAPEVASPSAVPIAAPTAPPALVAAVRVTPVKEPNDQAHRNYCGAGATQVLVSAWLPTVPDIEAVARLSHLNPKRGQSGADTVVAVNALLAPVAHPALGADVYGGRHATGLAEVLGALTHDLPGPRLIAALGHGAPVMVQTMTRHLPGWNGWQATHMITIYAYDLRSGDPATDTVSYAETPSPQAAYTGPPTQTVSVATLWTAMLEHNADAPDDPVNLIS